MNSQKEKLKNAFSELGYEIVLDDSLNTIYRSKNVDENGNALCIDFDKVEETVAISFINIIYNEYTPFSCLIIEYPLVELINKQMEYFGWKKPDGKSANHNYDKLIA